MTFRTLLSTRMASFWRRLHQTGLRGRLVSLVLLGLVPMFLVQVFQLNARVDRQVAQEIQSNREVADGIGITFSSYLDRVWAVEGEIAASVLQTEAEAPGAMAEILRTREDQMPGVRQLVWLGAGGEVVRVGADTSLTLPLITAANWIKDDLGNHAVTDLLPAPTGGHPTFAVLQHVTTGSAHLGTVVALVDPEALDHVFPLERADQRTFGLVDRANHIVFRSGAPNQSMDDRMLADNGPTSQALGGKVALMGEDVGLIDRQSLLGAAVPVADVGWAVFADAAGSAVLAHTRSDARRGLVLNLAVCLATITAAVVAANRLVKPLTNLKRAANAIALGDLSARVGYESSGDGELAAALQTFDDMAERIGLDEEELRTRARQQAVVAELGRLALHMTDVKALMAAAVNMVTATLHPDYCHVLELQEDGRTLLMTAGYGWPDGTVGHSRIDGESDPHVRQCLHTDMALVTDLPNDPRFQSEGILSHYEIKSGISVLMRGPDRLIGLLGIAALQRRTFTPDDVNFLQGVANVLGAALEQARSVAELRQSRERLAFLARVSEVLAGTLDYAATLENVAELVVPQLGDWCLVDMVGFDGTIRRTTAGHRDPARAHRVHRLSTAFPDVLLALPECERIGTASVLAVVPEPFPALTFNWEELHLIQGLALHSLMVVPIRSAGRLLGQITIASTAPNRRYGEADVAIAEELARRAAQAIEHVLLHHSVSAISNSIGEGVLAVDRSGSITFVNPAAEQMSGRTREELLGNAVSSIGLLHEDDSLPEVLKTGETRRVPDTVLVRNDDTTLPVSYTASPIISEGEVMGAVIAIHDTSERKAFEEKLQHQAFHDSLTGLPNRRYFLSRLGQAIPRARQIGTTVAVLVIDTDNFKLINDTYGHMAGDQALIGVARALQQSVRSGDTVGRFGGDEFSVLLENIHDASDVAPVAERIFENLKTPITVDGKEVFISCSVGAALLEPSTENPSSLVQNADIALYRSKTTGKGRYMVYEPSMNAHVRSKVELEGDLHRALQRNEFVLHYQPVVSLWSGQIVGAEALIRWDHPQRGLVYPGAFIPLAEETGLILPMSRWILREACQQLRRWHQQFPEQSRLKLNVNLSSRHFLQATLPNEVAEVLRETGLKGEFLQLEITESTLMQDDEMVFTTLRRLRALGISLAIDDFGTGYSSLSYLKRLPVSILKIDKSFVGGLGKSTEDTAIVRTVTALAKNLKLLTTAEGVETADQAQALRAMGCDTAQGYYLARPMPADALSQLIAQRRNDEGGAALS